MVVLATLLLGIVVGVLRGVGGDVAGLTGPQIVALTGASGGARSISRPAPEFLHGSEPDRDDEVVQFGARHMLLRDGLWMQPEPLLYLGVTNGDLTNPLMYGGLYAAGNTNLLHDRSGYCLEDLCFVEGVAAVALADVVVEAIVAAGTAAVEVASSSEVGAALFSVLTAASGASDQGAVADPAAPAADSDATAPVDESSAASPGGLARPGIETELPSNPEDLLDQGYEEVSHPDAKAAGHRRFTNPETGDTLEFDEGQEGEPGHAGKDHYHRPNPNKTGKGDARLDADGNPVPKGSDDSHLYPSGGG